MNWVILVVPPLASLSYIYFVYGEVENYDKYHWIILAPITFNILGFILDLKYFMSLHGFWKLLLILSILANLGLAVLIFIFYSFTYWQF